MATQPNNAFPADSQRLGVTAVARSIRGQAAITFQISVPTETGSNLVEVRRSTLAAFVSAAIDAMDDADGEADSEDDDPAESDGCEDDASWVEWNSMRGPSKRSSNFTLGHEDAEEDDPQGDTTEDEPAFDAASRALANMKGSTGPGCVISDVDCGGEEGGEVAEGAYGHACHYGVDQTKPIGPENPVLR